MPFRRTTHLQGFPGCPHQGCHQWQKYPSSTTKESYGSVCKTPIWLFYDLNLEVQTQVHLQVIVEVEKTFFFTPVLTVVCLGLLLSSFNILPFHPGLVKGYCVAPWNVLAVFCLACNQLNNRDSVSVVNAKIQDVFLEGLSLYAEGIHCLVWGDSL